MKKSEIERQLMSFGQDYAKHALGLMDAAGTPWDPEDEVWPELLALNVFDGRGVGIKKGRGALATVCLDESREGTLANRIARAWNARRPGGEMEKRLKKVRDSYPEGSAGYEEIDDALRLGVEE